MRLILEMNDRLPGRSCLRGAIRACIVGCVLFLAFSALGLVLLLLIVSQ